MRKQQIIIVFINLFLFLSFSFFTIYAEWIDPKEIIVGKWGKELGQFYYESQDTSDAFPRSIGIDKNNNVIISDEGNKRVYVFSQNGKLLNTILKSSELSNVDFAFGRWPGEIILLPYNNYIIFSCDYKQVAGGYQPLKQCVVNYNGKIISKIEVAETFAATDGLFLLKNDKHYHYSPTGQLLKTYDTRPLELGVVNRQSIGGGNYETTIEYPDKKWKVKGLCMKYMQDACGVLYCVDNAIVIRYDDEGKDVAFIGMPNEKSEETPEPPNLPPGIDIPVSILEQYGSPVLAPNGDVYTWKRTPDKYSILKWVWVDGPECPQYLEVKPTANSLKFTWQKPLKDADKITYYQLLQSYNICGPFRQTALLKKGQLSYEDRDVKKGETYYYIVKAVRGKEFSGNSNKVCGQIE